MCTPATAVRTHSTSSFRQLTAGFLSHVTTTPPMIVALQQQRRQIARVTAAVRMETHESPISVVVEGYSTVGQASRWKFCTLAKCASGLRAIIALKHRREIHGSFVEAGTSNRLHARRTRTGPLLEASAVPTRAGGPRSRPEQQHTTRSSEPISPEGAQLRPLRDCELFDCLGVAPSSKDGVAHAEEPSSTVRPWSIAFDRWFTGAWETRYAPRRFAALATQTQASAK